MTAYQAWDFDAGYEAGRKIADLAREATLPRYAEILAYSAATCEERGVPSDRVVPMACAFTDVYSERGGAS